MRVRWTGSGIRLVTMLLALTLLAFPALALAQSTEQRQSRPETGAGEDAAGLDLAALMLTNEDLAEFGLEGYGIASGEMRSLRTTAESYADDRGGKTPENIDRFASFLEGVGWLRGYESGLAVLDEDDPAFFSRVVTSNIDVYETESGASRSFTELSNPEDVTVVEIEPVADVQPLGDDAHVWLVSGDAEDTGEPFRAVLAMFRTGNIEAGVGMYFWDDSEPEIELVQELAARLLERIEAAEPAAEVPLSAAALTFGETGLESFYHNYLLRDETIIPFAGESIEELANRELAYRNATEVYTVNQLFPAGAEGTADDGYYALWRYRFADAGAASAWFEEESGRFTGSVVDLDAGDRAFAYSYTFEVAPGALARGYVGYMLVGADVAIIDMRAIPEMPLVSFVDVLRFQAVCMNGTEPCRMADIPWQLRLNLVPEATPAAGTPAAGTPEAGTPEAGDGPMSPGEDAEPVPPIATPEAGSDASDT